MIKPVFTIACIISIIPAAFANTYAIDPRDSEISRLIQEKQTKYAQLERCVKATKGLQIAGISTLGLTAGGVALNISQANKKKTLDNKIDSVNTQIEKKKQEIEEKRRKEEQERAKKAEEAAQARAKAECEADGTKTYTNGQCVLKTTDTDDTNDEIETVAENPETTQTENKEIYFDNVSVDSLEKCNKYRATFESYTECYQDTDGNWRVRYTVSEGDECECEASAAQQAETCKYKYSGNMLACKQDKCKDGYYFPDGYTYCVKKEAVTCKENERKVLNYTKDGCDICPDRYIAKNGKCEKCPDDQKLIGNSCEPFDCNPSEYKSEGICKKCPYENQIEENNICKTCPSDRRAVNNQCDPFVCEANQYKTEGRCETCPDNMAPNEDQTGCKTVKTYEMTKAFESKCAQLGGEMTDTYECTFNLDIEDKLDFLEKLIEKCDSLKSEIGVPVDPDGKTSSCYIS